MVFSDCTTIFFGQKFKLSAFAHQHAYTFAKMVMMMKKNCGPDCTDQDAQDRVLSLLTRNPAERVWDALEDVARKREAAAREAEEEARREAAAREAEEEARREATPNAKPPTLHMELRDFVLQAEARRKAEEEATPTCTTCTGSLVCVCVC